MPPALLATPDLWLSGELCKIRNPEDSHLWFMQAEHVNGRAIFFRETIFRGMDSRPGAAPSSRKGSPPLSARLDAIDRKILKELQDDGRMTNVELARRVGISAPPCLRRVRALEEAGYIKGYRALLDEKKLGYEVSVFAMVHLASQAETDLTAF